MGMWRFLFNRPSLLLWGLPLHLLLSVVTLLLDVLALGVRGVWACFAPASA
jgi:hypothetical protein